MENIKIDPNELIKLAAPYAISFIKAIVILFVGLYIIKKLTNGLKSILSKREVDPSLVPFLLSLSGVGLKIVLVISVIGILGVETTSFAAVIAAGGLAVGLALSGTLQNFAGGVILLIFKPFKVGDFVDTQGFMGTIHSIQIFNTVLKTTDNKTIIIPNGVLSNSSMTNFTTESTRRVEWNFGIAYGDNTQKTKEILRELIENDPRILKEPLPTVAVSSLGDSSVNFVVRAWVNSPDFWPVFFEMNENVYNTFNAKGINIPFPQMDVHLHQKNPK